MNMLFFKKNIIPRLGNYKFTYSSYPDGDFGSMERAVIEGNNKVAIVDIWSKGWLNIEIYDSFLDERIMTVLLEPTESEKQKESIDQLMQVFLNDK